VIAWIIRRARRYQDVAEVEGSGGNLDQNLVRAWGRDRFIDFDEVVGG
jgi:hypothetical protein